MIDNGHNVTPCVGGEAVHNTVCRWSVLLCVPKDIDIVCLF